MVRRVVKTLMDCVPCSFYGNIGLLGPFVRSPWQVTGVTNLLRTYELAFNSNKYGGFILQRQLFSFQSSIPRSRLV